MDSFINEIETIRGSLEQYRKEKIFKDLISFIDLTTLNPTDTNTSVKAMTEKVNNFKIHYPKFHNVASICTYPNFSSLIKNVLKAPGVRITAVGGCFPASQSFDEIKAAECRMAVEKGADEIDIVLPLNKFLDNRYEDVHNELSLLREATKGATLKIILETGALKDPEIIKKACDIAMECGADFLKTSTGKLEPAATPEAAYIMCSRILEKYRKDGTMTGLKPAGGIATIDDALIYYAIVDKVLGKKWLTPQHFRIGASRLANKLLSQLTGFEVTYF